MKDFDCNAGIHEYASFNCPKCGKEYCWTCAVGPHHDSGSWGGMKCPHCEKEIEYESQLGYLVDK